MNLKEFTWTVPSEDPIRKRDPSLLESRHRHGLLNELKDTTGLRVFEQNSLVWFRSAPHPAM